MGDRYILDLICDKCKKVNSNVYYAPSCDFIDFVCIFCGTKNFISSCFTTSTIAPIKDPYINSEGDSSDDDW